jgi:hypothetical protein
MKKESTRLSLVTASELCKFAFAFSCTSETILRCGLIFAPQRTFQNTETPIHIMKKLPCCNAAFFLNIENSIP